MLNGYIHVNKISISPISVTYKIEQVDDFL